MTWQQCALDSIGHKYTAKPLENCVDFYGKHLLSVILCEICMTVYVWCAAVIIV